MQEEKIMRLGEGRNHYWFISAASCFVSAKLDPDSASAAKHRAVEQVTRLFYMMLTSQEDMGTNAQAPQAAGAGASPRIEHLLPQDPKDVSLPQAKHIHTGAPASGGSDFDPFQHLDPAEWALDNLWPIDNLDFTAMQGPDLGL